jgi:hypothetical protein
MMIYNFKVYLMVLPVSIYLGVVGEFCIFHNQTCVLTLLL